MYYVPIYVPTIGFFLFLICEREYILFIKFSEKKGGTWQQIGQDIDGESAVDESFFEWFF